MKYIKILKEDDVMELLECRADVSKVDRAKEIIGQAENNDLRGVGDSMVRIHRAIKYALYEDNSAKTTVYRIPVLVPDNEMAFCITVY